MNANCRLIDAKKDGDSFAALLSEGKPVRLRVTGTSMLPLLNQKNTVVWLEGCSGESARRGDILLFRRPDGSFVLHRVLKTLPNGRLMMNGDAQSWCETIERKAVLAIVRKIEKNGKIRSCGSLLPRLYSLIWTHTLSVRPLLLKALGRAARLLHSLKRGTHEN